MLFGMVSYLNKYSPRLAEFGDSLTELTKDMHHLWCPEHTETFEAFKKEITGAHLYLNIMTLKDPYFAKDASFKGLGAVLLQEGHTIYFASKSLQLY